MRDNRLVQVLRFSASVAERIGQRPYEVNLASSIELAKGEGDAHAYVIYFEPGGIVGHEAGSARSSLRLPAAAGSRAGVASESLSQRVRPRSSAAERCTQRAARAE